MYAEARLFATAPPLEVLGLRSSLLVLLLILCQD